MNRVTLASAFVFGLVAIATSAVADQVAPQLPGVNAPLAPKAPAPKGTDKATPEPERVTRTGCIFRPGGRFRFNIISASRITQYRVVPDSNFDVVLEVQYAGFGVNRADRFFEGGPETLRIRSPGGRQFRVAVTISGFRGSTGCFRFQATP